MTVTSWRRPASIAAAAIVASAVPLLAVSAPADAATPVQKTVTYDCKLFVGLPGFPIQPGDEPFLGDNLVVPVGITFTVPDLRAGETVPETAVKVDLDLGSYEDPTSPTGRRVTVRDGAALIGGTAVDGSSTDAALEVRANGESTKYVINGLSTTKFPVEQDYTKGWVIPVNGTSPTIEIPKTTSVDLLAPDVFTIDATVFAPTSDTDPTFKEQATARVDCVGPSEAERLLATVPVESAAVDPTPDPTDDPTTDPTDDPTTDPTDDPTVAPTTGVGNGGNGSTSGDVSPANATTGNGVLPNTGAPEQLAMIGALGVALLLGGGLVARRRTTIARRQA